MTASINISETKIFILCLLILNLLSLGALYSSLHQEGEFVHQEHFYRQIIWIAIAWIFLIIFAFINYRYYFDLAFILYGLNLLLLVIVILIGKEVMGAQRWLTIGGVNFQPSELSKLTNIFILARFFIHGRRQTFLSGVAAPLGLIIINALLIFKQPDLGTALILIFLFFIIACSCGIKKRYLIALLIGAVIISPIAWRLLKDYQKKRLSVFVNPSVDPLGAGYTIIQSKIAIGSGKVFGKGFLSGTQNQFNFLPERHTDFIFTVIAEEWGLIGAIFLLLIYWLILRKILDCARRAKDPFAQGLLIGISVFFFLHIFINVGMTLGILPVVGLPLAFISYGGSNLLVSFILMGIVFNISAQS